MQISDMGTLVINAVQEHANLVTSVPEISLECCRPHGVGPKAEKILDISRAIGLSATVAKSNSKPLREKW